MQFSGFLGEFLRKYDLPSQGIPEKARKAGLLRAVTNLKLKDIALRVGYTYGTLRGYTAQSEFKRLIEEARKAFVDKLTARVEEKARKYWEKLEEMEEAEELPLFDPTGLFKDCKLYNEEVRKKLEALADEILEKVRTKKCAEEDMPVLVDTSASLWWISTGGKENFANIRGMVWEEAMPAYLKTWCDEIRERVERIPSLDEEDREEILMFLTILSEYLEI